MPDEVTLRDYIDLKICNVVEKINGVSAKIDAQTAFNSQHFELNELAIKKAEDSMTARLEGMNEFREQIKEERANYVTRDILALTVKERNIRLEALENAKAENKGQTEGKAASYAFIFSIIAALLAIGGFILALVK